MSRLLLCAPSSGAGKTTVCCALLSALKQRGESPVAFKSGPDYIDPMFHSQIIGTPSYNLDLFLMGEQEVVRCLASHTQEGSALCKKDAPTVAILEGAMGYYDGIAMGDRASAYHLATVTQTPAVLVIDARGAALSIVAQIQGFLDFRGDSQIQGVILNRVSPMLYPRLKELIEAELPVKVYGYLPKDDSFTLESRHLGLVTALEVEELQEKMRHLGEIAQNSLDIEGLLALAHGAPVLETAEPASTKPQNSSIAIARDKAFCFYYADALQNLERQGVKFIPFSPLVDEALPEDIQGLYLGGGYPELYGKELSENTAMCGAIKEAIEAGLPTIAECGGFLYLHETLEDAQGTSYPMCGVIAGSGYGTKKLSRFGYITLTTEEDGLLIKKGDTINAHEFHYWDSTHVGGDCHATKPQSTRNWDCIHQSETLYAGFPHLYMNETIANRLIDACIRYGGI